MAARAATVLQRNIRSRFSRIRARGKTCRRLNIPAANSAGQRRFLSAATVTEDDSQTLSTFMSTFSIEVTPNAAKKINDFSSVQFLEKGTTVNVTYLVGADIEESIGICSRLADADMNPVAHVPSRAFGSLVEVEEYFVRLRDIGVNEILVLGGGSDQPKGNLHESMQILESGLVQKYGFSKVGVAAHPEGHPDISNDDLRHAILKKAEWASATSTPLYFETQFCFDSTPILNWEKATRTAIVEHLERTMGKNNIGALPSVRLGIAGPARISSLIKFGVMSGVGNSLSFLTK